MFTQETIAKIETIVKVKTIKGTSFVGVRNYTNTQGEISNQTFLIGISYANLLDNDLQKLAEFDINSIMKQYPDKRLIVLEAYNELLESLIKRTGDEKSKQDLRDKGDETITRSDANINAYEYIDKGLKHKEGILYVTGLRVKKEVLKPVEYPTTNSKIKTIIKKQIKKAANLRAEKYRQYKLGALESLKIQGATITPSGK